MDHVGGGFGSKFAADKWGVECTQLSRTAAASRQALSRPRHRAEDRRRAAFGVCQDQDRRQERRHDHHVAIRFLASGGFAGGGSPPLPYVFTNIANQRKNHTAVSINAGGARAWRAPNHQQACYLTDSAIDDLAAKLNMDPVDVLAKNADLTPRPEVYRLQLQKTPR